MKTDTRRVYTFITLGLISAVIVGLAVWFAGTPASPSASDTATQTPEVSTVSASAQTESNNLPLDEREEDEQPQVVATPEMDDPFLAPNAVVQAAPQLITPTVVYRPDNIAPQQDEQTNASAEPVDETFSPQVPTAEAEITVSAEPSVPTEPSEPTEPTEPPAPPVPTDLPDTEAPTGPTETLDVTDPADAIVSVPATTSPLVSPEAPEAAEATEPDAEEPIEPAAPSELSDPAQPSENGNDINDDTNNVAEIASPAPEEAATPGISWSSWSWPFKNWF